MGLFYYLRHINISLIGRGGVRMKKAKRIPITAAKRIANEYGYDKVIVVAISDEGPQHVTTYGVTVDNCLEAAKCGNFIKRLVLQWPEELCHARPARAKLKGNATEKVDQFIPLRGDGDGSKKGL